jgi:glycosyltransferase involved in cell wall biosynthesis
MSAHYDVTLISSEKPKLEKLGQAQGVNTYHVEMTRQITPLADLKSVWKLYRYFKKEKPFIVHSHTPKAGIVSMLAAKLAGVPHRLHTVAGLPLLEAVGTKRKILNFVEKLTYSAATFVYPNSYGLLEIIKEHRFAPPSKLKVLANGSSNGINVSWFSRVHFSEDDNYQLKTRLNILPEHFVFIFVGRLVKDKGINELIAAFVELHNQFPNVRLLLVGNYEHELDPLQPETVSTIDSSDFIIPVGFQQDVRPYFAISDALVFPTYREGFPNGVLQAAAMDLPCIVTNINGCNEIITDGHNGMIIPVKDQAAVFEAMRRLYSDKNLYIAMRNVAREIIVSRYGQQYVWESILNEYKNLEAHV